jgi:hypothetical protein
MYINTEGEMRIHCYDLDYFPGALTIFDSFYVIILGEIHFTTKLLEHSYLRPTQHLRMPLTLFAERLPLIHHPSSPTGAEEDPKRIERSEYAGPQGAPLKLKFRGGNIWRAHLNNNRVKYW